MKFFTPISEKGTSCCFTGHRPAKLSISEDEVRRLLRQAISDAFLSGITSFITGMADGVDIWAADEVLNFKLTHRNVRLICALPYPNFVSNRSREKKALCEMILSSADEIYTLSDTYSYDCYQKRNMWMVDHSSRVIAFYQGIPGGTKNTIDYAKRKSIHIINMSA